MMRENPPKRCRSETENGREGSQIEGIERAVETISIQCYCSR